MCHQWHIFATFFLQFDQFMTLQTHTKTLVCVLFCHLDNHSWFSCFFEVSVLVSGQRKSKTLNFQLFFFTFHWTLEKVFTCIMSFNLGQKTKPILEVVRRKIYINWQSCIYSSKKMHSP